VSRSGEIRVSVVIVDHMHTVVVPILLGRGVRLWDGLEGLEKDYEIEATSSPSGVTHGSVLGTCCTGTWSLVRSDRPASR
jgi:hypothetical protein